MTLFVFSLSLSSWRIRTFNFPVHVQWINGRYGHLNWLHMDSGWQRNELHQVYHLSSRCSSGYTKASEAKKKINKLTMHNEIGRANECEHKTRSKIWVRWWNEIAGQLLCWHNNSWANMRISNAAKMKSTEIHEAQRCAYTNTVECVNKNLWPYLCTAIKCSAAWIHLQIRRHIYTFHWN